MSSLSVLQADQGMKEGCRGISKWAHVGREPGGGGGGGIILHCSTYEHIGGELAQW